MDRLYWKYSDYLQSLEKELGIAPRGTYTTTEDHPLDQLVKDMITHKRHHVYLLDESGKPVRVISLGDVLRFPRN
jgi:CBS domain-containing protein